MRHKFVDFRISSDKFCYELQQNQIESKLDI